MTEKPEPGRAVTVAELLARHGQGASTTSRAHRRRAREGGISVAELTGEIPIYRDPPPAPQAEEPARAHEAAQSVSAHEESIAEDTTAYQSAAAAAAADWVARLAQQSQPTPDPDPASAATSVYVYDSASVYGYGSDPASDPDPAYDPTSGYAPAYDSASGYAPDPAYGYGSDPAYDPASGYAPAPDPASAYDPASGYGYSSAYDSAVDAGPQSPREFGSTVAFPMLTQFADSAMAESDWREPATVEPAAAVTAEAEPDRSAEALQDKAALRQWGVLAGQAVVGVGVGAALFVGFERLWDSLPYVALILAILAILGMVAVVRILRKTDDIASVLIAVVVGVIVTIGPLAFVLSTR